MVAGQVKEFAPKIWVRNQNDLPFTNDPDNADDAPPVEVVDKTDGEKQPVTTTADAEKPDA
ncbi:hypothetical protein [Rubripirellula tenax]|uniref:hypothetical protein n=1 Tax=Rubripirellula tenax TaxID=2528015 RepID=UPI0016469353|nr:hypothetical protein [Rubripirellula tenax]